MSGFGNASDEIIKRAIDEGAFDNLPGKGKPLVWNENPHESEDWQLAYHLLRNNGYSLPWLDLRNEIDQAADQARAEAMQAFEHGRWQEYQGLFKEQIEALNQRIFQYNLQAPSTQFHLLKINLSREIEIIQHGSTDQPLLPGGE